MGFVQFMAVAPIQLPTPGGPSQLMFMLSGMLFYFLFFVVNMSTTDIVLVSSLFCCKCKYQRIALASYCKTVYLR